MRDGMSIAKKKQDESSIMLWSQVWCRVGPNERIRSGFKIAVYLQLSRVMTRQSFFTPPLHHSSALSCFLPLHCPEKEKSERKQCSKGTTFSCGDVRLLKLNLDIWQCNWNITPFLGYLILYWSKLVIVLVAAGIVIGV